MRDLKHIYYFEKLLENSYNDLIGEAQEQGRKASATSATRFLSRY